MTTQLTTIAEKLNEVAAQLTALSTSTASPVPPGKEVSLLRVAERLVQERRLILMHMQDDLFADPARDLLLDLFIARAKGVRVSISSACIAAAVPPTTALRHIARLADTGLVTRMADDHDGRRIFVELSDRGWEAMVAYVEAASRVWSLGNGQSRSVVG